MRFGEFFIWNAAGGITWGVSYGLVGYFAGSAAAGAITRFGIYAAIGLAVVLVVGYSVIKLRERRRTQETGD